MLKPPNGQTVPRLAVWTIGAIGGDALSQHASAYVPFMCLPDLPLCIQLFFPPAPPLYVPFPHSPRILSTPPLLPYSFPPPSTPSPPSTSSPAPLVSLVPRPGARLLSSTAMPCRCSRRRHVLFFRPHLLMQFASKDALLWSSATRERLLRCAFWKQK